MKDQVALRKRRLERLQAIAATVDPNSMESLIRSAQERLEEARSKAETLPDH
jgi:hypothetical protein